MPSQQSRSPTAKAYPQRIGAGPETAPTVLHCLPGDPTAATTLQNSFTSDNTVSSGKFRKENGVVYVEGYLNLPASFEINAGQTFFIAPIIDQLPLGYRPDSLLVKRVTVQDEASGGSQNWNTPTIVSLNASGILQFQYITTDSNHYIPVATGTPHKLWFGFSYLAA